MITIVIFLILDTATYLGSVAYIFIYKNLYIRKIYWFYSSVKINLISLVIGGLLLIKRLNIFQPKSF